MGTKLPIRVPVTEPVRRRARGAPRPKRELDRQAHAAKLAGEISQALAGQAESTMARDASLPSLPPGIQLLIEPARSPEGKALSDVEVPRAWGLHVIEERQDGSVVAVRRGDGLDAFARAVEGWRESAKDEKGHAKPGTRSVEGVDRVRRASRRERIGEELLAVDPELTERHVVDVEFAAGKLDEDGGPGRRHKFKNYIQKAGGDLVGEPLIADDYCVFRVSLPAEAIRDLVENHIDVESVDLPPRIEREAYELAELTADQVEPLMEEPAPNATPIGVIDSGIIPSHPFLRAAVQGRPHRSWIPGQPSIVPSVNDDAQHGTGVGSVAALGSLRSALVPAFAPVRSCPVIVARVLGAGSLIPNNLHLAERLPAIVKHLSSTGRARIINHSINAMRPFRQTRMSVWAERLDHIAHAGGNPGQLLIVSTGNVDGDGTDDPAWLQEQVDHGRYPHYLLDARCRLRDPAQAMNVLTVGGYVPNAAVPWRSRQMHGLRAIAGDGQVSPFSRSGAGYRGAIKPELVEEAGNSYVDASGSISRRRTKADVAVADADYSANGCLTRWDVGTSYAAPLVANHAARLTDALPDMSVDLLRAILVNVAEWPVPESSVGREAMLRLYGYGVPRLARVLELGGSRVMLVSEGRIGLGRVAFVDVPFPRHLFSSPTENKVRLSVTLAYRAPVRRSDRRYLGARMEWHMAGRDEREGAFQGRLVHPKDIDLDDDAMDGDEGGGPGGWSWTVGPRRRRRGTCQKDWLTAPVAYFDDVIRLAVVARKGWLKGKAAEQYTQHYALSVLVEALDVDVPLYETVRASVRSPGARVRLSAQSARKDG
jgi:hypothetical protein